MHEVTSKTVREPRDKRAKGSITQNDRSLSNEGAFAPLSHEHFSPQKNSLSPIPQKKIRPLRLLAPQPPNKKKYLNNRVGGVCVYVCVRALCFHFDYFDHKKLIRRASPHVKRSRIIFIDNKNVMPRSSVL